MPDRDTAPQDAQRPLTRRAARAVERTDRDRFSSGFHTLRDLASFVFGVALIVHEVFVNTQADAYIVGVGVAFCGLPLVLGADEKKRPQ